MGDGGRGRTLTRVFIIVFVLGIVGGLAGNARAELPNVTDSVLPGVVAIYSLDEHYETIGQGTGFFISSTDGQRLEILTNYHVLDRAMMVMVETNDQLSRGVNEVLYSNPERDMVVVSVRVGTTDGVIPLPLAPTLPPLGEKLFVVSPLRHNPDEFVRTGFLIELSEEFSDGSPSFFRTSAGIVPGNSGSPVMTKDGQVVGIATSRAVGLPLSRAMTFFQQSRPDYDGEDGIPFREWAEQQRRARANEYAHEALEYETEGNLETALFFYGKAVEQDPTYGEVWFQIGSLNGRLNRHAEAVDAYETLLYHEVYGGAGLYSDALYNLALELARMGHYERSEASLLRHVAQDPYDARSVALLTAVYAIGLRDVEAAAEMYELLQQSDPERAESLRKYVLDDDEKEERTQ